MVEFRTDFNLKYLELSNKREYKKMMEWLCDHARMRIVISLVKKVHLNSKLLKFEVTKLIQLLDLQQHFKEYMAVSPCTW